MDETKTPDPRHETLEGGDQTPDTRHQIGDEELRGPSPKARVGRPEYGVPKDEQGESWGDGIRYQLRIYFLLVAANIHSRLQYRFSTIAELVGFFFTTFSEFFVTLIVFSRIDALAGWSLGEVALLYALSSMAFALAELVGAGFDNFAPLIRTGKFDTLLVRPISDFAQVLSSDFVVRRISRFVQGAIVLALGLTWLGIRLAWWQVLVMMGAVFCGTLMYISLFVVQSAACFWSIEGLEVFNILTYGSSEAMGRPMEIYGGWLRRFLTFVLPMVFISYLPVRLILGKGNLPGSYPSWAGWLAPLVGIGFFLIARRVWDFGVRHYQSTGS